MQKMTLEFAFDPTQDACFGDAVQYLLKNGEFQKLFCVNLGKFLARAISANLHRLPPPLRHRVVSATAKEKGGDEWPPGFLDS